MAIDIKNLTQKDVDRWVVHTRKYPPSTNHGRPFNQEFGRIKSWNDKYIFVVYRCANLWDQYQDYTGCPTNPEDLDFHDQ